MQCDWYAATIKASENNVLSVLKSEYGTDVKDISGKNGYEDGIQFLNKFGDVEVTMFTGGNNGASPHVFASSDRAIKFREICRSEWTNNHEVTRIDVCEDFDGGFEEMSEQLLTLANKKNLYIDQRGDWIRKNSKQGRTLYLGATTSPVRCRLYEKGKQLAEAFTNTGLLPPKGFPIQMVRLEAQVRPVKHQRKVAAVCELKDIWGYSKWLQEVAKNVLETDAMRCSADAFRSTDRERALQFLVKQYGKTLSLKANELGSWGEVGLLLEKMYNEYEEVKQIKARTMKYKDIEEY